LNLSNKSLAVLQREALLFVSNLVTSIAVARTLGPHALGLWVILALIPSYAEMVGRIKVDAAAVYLLGKGVYQLGDVVACVHLVAGISSAILMLGFLAFYQPLVAALFGTSAAQVRVLVLIMLVQIPAHFLYMNYTYLHVHREDVRSVNAMALTRALATSALVLCGLLVFRKGLAAVVLGSTLAVILAMSVGAWRFGRVARSPAWLSRSLLRDLLAYGGRLYIGTMLSHLNTYSSQAIVVAFCLPAQVAFFTIAQQLAQLITKITESMGTFLFPQITKQREAAAATQLAARAFRVSLTILLPIGVFAAVSIRPVLLSLYGATYEPALAPFYLLLPGVILAGASGSLTIYFQGIGRADLVPKIAVVPLVVQVGFGLWLVPQFATIGAAVALLGALAATAALQAFVFAQVSGASLRRDLVPRFEDFRLVVEFVGSVVRQRLGWFAR
jgi:O-antigen/teichoic acid export membrane protein